MNRIADRMVVLVCSSLCTVLSAPDRMIYMLLLGIVAAGLCFFFYGTKMHLMLCMAIAVLMIVEKFCFLFLPVLLYETFSDFADGRRSRVVIPLVSVSINVVEYIFVPYNVFVRFGSCKNGMIGVMLLGIFLSFYLAYVSSDREKLRYAKFRIRDDSEEFFQGMLEKNKLICERQDHEIAMAMLKERNRIAREIHDNVGHLLSRAIIQMGAVQAMNRDEALAGALSQVSATLGESMNKIRQSVHDLHNESFDLEKALRDILDQCEEYDVILHYSMESSVPINIKYCVVSLVSEALSNVGKHSDATKVVISVMEHPGFYQMIIEDNGHPQCIRESGIGLHNMESRIKELGGNLSVSIENGFRIFCTVPRRKDK